jgi:prepilin-type N-terminal cleavage/methylation domain-containing protein
MPIRRHKKKEQGFTLVEVLIAILILAIALTSVFYVLVININDAVAISNNFIASGLAQEGIEVVRNIRDRDWFLSNAWGASLPDGIYRVQWNSIQCDGAGQPVGCSVQPLLPFGSNPTLGKDSASGIYSYTSGGNTPFQRTLTVSTISAVEKKIVVNVNWNERGVPKSLSAEEHLFNWFK